MKDERVQGHDVRAGGKGKCSLGIVPAVCLARFRTSSQWNHAEGKAEIGPDPGRIYGFQWDSRADVAPYRVLKKDLKKVWELGA